MLPIVMRLTGFLNKKYSCPLCGTRQRKFVYFGHDIPVLRRYDVIGAGKRRSRCAQCGSTDRERLIYVFLRDELRLFNAEKLLRVLHMAPERNLFRKLKACSTIEYVAGDNLEAGYRYGADVVKINITQIPFQDGYFDLIICNHVLEHVADDHAAMSELYRVLKDGGMAILQVPFSPVLACTLEDASLQEPERRLRVFGQKDHVRIYGRDYCDRLKKTGFTVETVRIADRACYKEFGLNPREDIFTARKQHVVSAQSM